MVEGKEKEAERRKLEGGKCTHYLQQVVQLFSYTKETPPGKATNISYEHRYFRTTIVQQNLILVGEGRSYSSEEKAAIFSLKPLIRIEIKGTSFHSNP